MVDRNKNNRQRGKYFLDRRSFVRTNPSKKNTEPTPESTGPMFPSPEIQPQPDEKEVESKLKALYDSLDTSYWDAMPRPGRKSKSSRGVTKKIDVSTKLAVVRLKLINLISSMISFARSSSVKDFTKNKKVITPVAAVIAIFLLLVVFKSDPAPTSGQIASVKGSSKINYDNAGYTPMMPRAASKRDVVESNLKYEPGKKVFSYNDSIAGGKGIVTSQQPLPKDYKNDPISGLTAIASNIGASDWLATSKGKMYYGKNESGDGQMVVFTYRNILMLMRSGSEINPMTWKSYVDSLE